MNLPSHEFDESLLTAYLDDEVTEVERVLVEQQLERSKATRKLLEELKSVRAMVRQLHQQSPARSFSKGPWSGAADVELKNTSVGGADLPKVTLVNPSSRTHWNWQHFSSLAALLIIGLGVGGLWLSNQSYFPRGPLSYRSREVDSNERSDGRLAPSTRLDDSFGSAAAPATDGPIASSNSLDGVTGKEMEIDSYSDEVSGRLGEERANKSPREADSWSEKKASAESLSLNRSGDDSKGGSMGRRGLAFEAEKPLPQEPTSGGLRDLSETTGATMPPPYAKMAIPLAGSVASGDEAQTRAAAAMDPAPTAPAPALVLSVQNRVESNRWLDQKNAPVLSASQQNIVDYFSQQAGNELLPHRNVEGEELANVSNGAFVFNDSQLFEPADTNQSAVIFRFKRIPSPKSVDEKIEEHNAADLYMADGKHTIFQYEIEKADQTIDKVVSVPESDQNSQSSEVASKSDLVEFQVPKADWSDGAIQLQQLGIPVPTEIPSDAVLDFEASPSSTNGRLAGEDKVSAPAKTKAADKEQSKANVQNWRFLSRLPDRKLQQQVARGQVIEDSPSMPAADQKNTVQADDLIRVRLYLKTE